MPIALLLFCFGLLLAALHVGLSGAPFDPTPKSPVVWALRNATAADATSERSDFLVADSLATRQLRVARNLRDEIGRAHV